MTRASKRRRMKQDELKAEAEQRVDGNSERSTVKTAKEAKEDESPVVVLAHGAGAPSSSDWMVRCRLPPISIYVLFLSVCVRIHLFPAYKTYVLTYGVSGSRRNFSSVLLLLYWWWMPSSLMVALVELS